MTLELVPWRGARVPILSPNEISRYTTQDYINWITSSQGYMGPPMPVMTYGKNPVEPISNSFEGFALGMLYVDGPVAAVEAYRLRVFGQSPLLYQEIVDGRAGDLFDDPALDRLRTPWAGATLSDLMKRALIYGDFAGNAFVVDVEDELVLIRPDWVEIILEKRMFRGQQLGWKQLGIVYYEGGRGRGDGVPFLPGEYAHFIPGLPDPLATYRGMSWLTPLVREVQADKAAGDHKVAFFENSASPNLAVSLPKEVTPAQFNEFVELMDSKHKGVQNTGKTLYTGGGADVTVIGANMQQQDFAGVVGKGETRIANAGGVSPVLLSFSEGMQGSSLNAGNYTPAKRNFVDTTMRDLWANFAGSIGQMDAFKAPKKASRLWYDGRDIPFLHEDAKDLAEIQQTRASTLSSYVTNGWKPESAVKAVAQDDLMLLEHSGAFSVQLQPPGAAMTPDTNGNGIADDAPTDGSTPPPPDFGALRADLWEFDEEDVLRAVEDLFDVDEDDLERARYDVRIEAGHAGGGRFRKLSDVAAALLSDWSKGDGPDDPLEKFDRPQLLRVMGDLRKKAVDAGDHERAARLTPRRGASQDQLKAALYADVRGAVRQERAGKPSAKFTLQGPDHRDLDVAVYKDKAGKPALFREGDTGKRGALVERFDSLDEMQAWADEHGEPKLSAWAAKESGPKAATAKATTRRGTGKVTADAAVTRLDSLKAELQKIPSARRKTALGSPSPVDVVGNYRERIASGEMKPEAVDTLLQRLLFQTRPDSGFEAVKGEQQKQAALDAGIVLGGGKDRRIADAIQAALRDLRGDGPDAPAKAAPRKVAPRSTAPDPEALDASLRDAKPEDRRAILEDAAKNQTQARRLASQLGVKGVSKLSRNDALDRIEAHYAPASPSPRGAAGTPTKRAPNRVAIAREAQALLDEQHGSADWTPEEHRDYAVRLNAMGDRVYDTGAGVALAHRLKDRAAIHRTKANVKERKAARKATPGAAGKGVPAARLGAFDPGDTARRLRDVRTEQEAIALLAGDPSLTSAKLRKVADELGIDVPADMRAKSALQLHIAEKVAPKAAPDGLDSTGAPKASDAEVEGRVRAAYDRLLTEPGGYVSLADLRDELPDVNREQLDRVLTQLNRQKPVRIVPESNQFALTQREQDATLTIGNNRRHLLAIEPDTQPVPAVDFLDRVHTGENAGLSPEDARAFAASGLSLDEWRAQRSEPFDEDDIERADSDGDVVEPDDDEDDEPDIDDILAMAAEDDDEDDASRAAGHDVTPGNDELHHWWTKGPGLARWASSPKPWTTLLANLVEAVKDKPIETLKKWTSRWYIEVFGYAAGSDKARVAHGKPPRGHVVGPG